MQIQKNQNTFYAGLALLAFRWVIGWTYFSAFWRRLVLENKLIPEEAGYIGEKFNHFLPNALGIKLIIEYLVLHPEALQLSMVIFTIVEAVVGLLLILGLFTRLMGIGVFGLAMGILLGSGWIGTTCLDEWQIGILGVAGGFTIFLAGSSAYSFDNYLVKKNPALQDKKWFRWFASGDLPIANIQKIVLPVSILLIGLTLFTNQVFHGGVWGKLHNKSVRPKVEISNIRLDSGQLQFQVYRVEGADVYGSFLIGIEILDSGGEVLLSLDGKDLAEFSKDRIHNHYVTKVKPGKHSLIIPLGAKADLTLPVSGINIQKGNQIRLIDVSGIEWIEEIEEI